MEDFLLDELFRFSRGERFMFGLRSGMDCGQISDYGTKTYEDLLVMFLDNIVIAQQLHFSAVRRSEIVNLKKLAKKKASKLLNGNNLVLEILFELLASSRGLLKLKRGAFKQFVESTPNLDL